MRPIIVGAGPVGLAAALFLARKGISTRIIDVAEEPSKYSKALAVNPRTLSLLESTGITAEMLRIGKPIQGAQLWSRGKSLAVVQLNNIHPRYPFMLALSQATTERLLTQALSRVGIYVERGAAMVSCRQRFATVEARIKHKNHDGTEHIDCPWVFAADGAHSKLRDILKVGFPGSSFNEPWSLVDVPLVTSRDPGHAHIEFLEGGGFLFMMPVYGDYETPSETPQIWRVLANTPDMLDHLHADEKPAGAPIWKSDFHISHRYADRMSVGCVHFAGDAAHLHSPVGARGMNLGVEDAWVFSKTVEEGRLDRYAALREPVDRQVVRTIEMVSRMVRGSTPLSRLAREHIVPRLLRVPFLADHFKKTITGLDHELPAIESHTPESFAIPSTS